MTYLVEINQRTSKGLRILGTTEHAAADVKSAQAFAKRFLKVLQTSGQVPISRYVAVSLRPKR